MKKKPWLAALLNVLITGLGYLYIRKRITFGILLIIGEILCYVWLFTDPKAISLMNNPWVAIAGILYIIAFAVDAYKCAKEL